MARKLILSFLICCFVQSAFSQNHSPYQLDSLTKEFHAGRRAALREKMPANSVAVFFASPVRNRSNDVDYVYHQDPDFYYLSGLSEPNALLLIFKDKQKLGGAFSDEYIFVQERDLKKETWNGKRLGKEGVQKKLGIEASFINKTFDGFKVEFSKYTYVLLKENAYEDCNIPENKDELNDMMLSFKLKTRFQNPNITTKKLSILMAELREVKLKEELVLIQKAIDATCEGHIEVMKALEPYMMEYQAQAIMEYHFKSMGCEYPGFPSIAGGGANSCILHYITNQKQLLSGDLLVLDVGGEYHGYTADVTRTIPVNGRFSTEQKEIYQLVLNAQMEGIKACLPGNTFWQPDIAAKETIKKGLLKLGIIKQESDLKKYFNHGSSHYLGLDVHDVGRYGKLTEGNIITVEPGIYIPEGSDCDPKWWNIGVRIEDDVLITKEGYKVLSEKAPKTVEEIEKLMLMKSIFNK